MRSYDITYSISVDGADEAATQFGSVSTQIDALNRASANLGEFIMSQIMAATNEAKEIVENIGRLVHESESLGGTS